MAVNKDESLDVTTTGGQDTAPVESSTAQGSGSSGSLRRFLREVLIELRKTNWPSWNELVKFTTVVLSTIIIVAIYLTVAQAVVGVLFNKIFPQTG